MEPPRRPEPHGRVVPGQRRQLARVRALVEREEHEREPRVVAVRGEQRAQVARVLGGDRDVGARVGPEARRHARVVVAERARVELHHQPVLGAQARHLHQHVRLEAALVGRRGPAAERAREERRGLRARQPLGVGLDHRVVGGRGA